MSAPPSESAVKSLCFLLVIKQKTKYQGSRTFVLALPAKGAEGV